MHDVEVYRKILAALTPAQKLATAGQAYSGLRELKAVGLRLLHPEWTEEEIQKGVSRAFSNLDEQIRTHGLLELWEKVLEEGAETDQTDPFVARA
jgi:hypothetical protein